MKVLLFLGLFGLVTCTEFQWSFVGTSQLFDANGALFSTSSNSFANWTFDTTSTEEYQGTLTFVGGGENPHVLTKLTGPFVREGPGWKISLTGQSTNQYGVIQLDFNLTAYQTDTGFALLGGSPVTSPSGAAIGTNYLSGTSPLVTPLASVDPENCLMSGIFTNLPNPQIPANLLRVYSAFEGTGSNTGTSTTQLFGN